MNRKSAIAFVLSIILPVIAFVVIAMRMAGGHRWHVAGILYAIGWLCLFYAARRHRRLSSAIAGSAARTRGFVRSNLGYIVVFVLTLALVYVGHTLFPGLSADQAELIRRSDSDLEMLPVYIAGLDAARAAIEAEKQLFQSAETGVTADARKKMLQMWSTYLAYSMELEQIKHAHRQFYMINFIGNPEGNLKSFLCGYSAFVANFRNAVAVFAVVGRNDFVSTVLDEETPELDIPRNSYFSLKQGAAAPDSAILLHAGQVNLQLHKNRGELQQPETRNLIAYCERNYPDILLALGKKPEVFAEAPKNVFEKHAFVAWLPLQKGVAEGMSMVRTTHRENLISPADVAAAMKELEPGDILVERRNWYLTNIGIPGFWPHTALYTGTLAEMDSFFTGCACLGGLSVSQYVEKNHPDLFKRHASKTKDGYEHRVIEAIGEGSVPTAFEISGRADYLGVVRPKLSKEDRLKALLRAFYFYNRPYDYNFDFMTDTELVCSELVFKSYQPAEGRTGLNFQLVETSGRLLLPPNNIVRKFDEEYGRDTADLDFVLFLEGSEAEGRAHRRTLEDFRASWRRPKWDVAQK